MVIVKFFNRLISFFDHKERFLVLEITAKKARGTLVKLDNINQEFIILKILAGEHASLKKLVKKLGDFNKCKIVVGLDPTLATTIHSSISLVRTNAKDPIDDADLDNLVSQAVWKFFDRHRNKVAVKMDINDFDVLLTDVRIGRIRLDGHKVVNPVGFKARSVEVQLSQTFTTRGVINQLKEFLPLENIVLITEAGTAWLHVIAQIHKEEGLLLANLFSDKTHLFSGNGQRLAYHDELTWGGDHMLEAVKSELGVGDEVARSIIRMFIKQKTSPMVARKIEQLILREASFLAKGLEMAMARYGHRLVYLNPFFELPPVLWSGSFKNKFGFSVKIMPVNVDFISENYNFKVKSKHRVGLNENLFGVVALILETTLLPSDKISQLARKRIRWLSPI